MKEYFISKDVSNDAINEYFRKSEEKKNEIHAIIVSVDGETKLEIAREPYSLDDKREIYSLSKSFTSAAIGAAVDEGLIDIDEPVISIFPDKVPEKISDNLRKMTVRHLLTMTTGHEDCVMVHLYSSKDPARSFLAQEVQYEPGTHFLYNTGASCMLGLILERKVGKSLYDYTKEKILAPLGIEGSRWTQCVNSAYEGGIGLHVSCRDIQKFGTMLYNKGVYEGKRILSEEWVTEAGKAQVDNSINGDSGTGNWTSGYGYQFWRTARDGYRGDGLKGQLCMIMPKNKAVVSIVGCTVDMEGEIADTVTLVENLLKEGHEELHLKSFEPIKCTQAGNSALYGKKIALDKNPLEIEDAEILKTETGIKLELTINGNKQQLFAGKGSWEKRDLYIQAFVPKILLFMNPYEKENIRVAASFTEENGDIVIYLRHLSNPHSVEMRFSENDGEIKLNIGVKEFPEMLIDEVQEIKGKIQ